MVVDHKLPIAVSWLPQHHDMGLIGYYIDIMLSGGTTIGFSPNTFVRRPALWFETITKYKATASSIPNFALELCLQNQRVSEKSLNKFDLTSLRFLMVAAEPVKADSFKSFLKKFSRCGLQEKSLFVAYGLAEFTLAVTNYGYQSLCLDSQALSLGFVKTGDSDSNKATIEIMSCGRPLADTNLKIVDPKTHMEVLNNRTGEIWINGNSMAKGYWSNHAATKLIFEAQINHDTKQSNHYLRTGDTGFLQNGELFVCGRIKDTLIIRGRNIYPQDIERVVQTATSKVRSGSIVAFNPLGSEEITVIAELVRIKDIPSSREIICAIRDALQISISRLAFLAPRSIPKTSSGKVRRGKARELFESRELRVISEKETDFSSSTSHNDLDIDVLEPIKTRYQLTGCEDYTLFDAGLDSLDLVTLLHWLKDTLDELDKHYLSNRISIRLFSIVTIKQIFIFARLIKENPILAVEGLTTALNKALDEHLDLEKKQMKQDSIYLPKYSLRTLSRTGITSEEGSEIFLTGGTGFLGPFLLLSLLQQTDVRINVLVRSDDQALAQKRLRQEFKNSVGSVAPMSCFDNRVKALSGDLTKPRFNLSDEKWQQLIYSTCEVYHNGALVNYLLDYQRMRQTNVVGTSNVIDFALSGQKKVFNHISTTFIFGWATKDILFEVDQNDNMDHLDFGYSQSKWVSEQLVFSAMNQGLDARIFRPALITPALDGYGGDSLDITMRLLAFMIKHAVCVNTHNQVSFMPVDLTANNIVSISNLPQTLNNTFHVTRDTHETLPQITDIISKKTGIQFATYSLSDFVPEVIKRCTQADSLYLLLDFLVHSVDNISAMEYKLYSNEQYKNAREKAVNGIEDAPLEAVVGGIIKFLDQKNLLPEK